MKDKLVEKVQLHDKRTLLTRVLFNTKEAVVENISISEETRGGTKLH